MNNTSVARLILVEKLIVITSFAFPFLFVLFLLAAKWPEYWKWIASENTPMTSIEVATMYTASLIAFAASGYKYIYSDTINSKRWLVLGGGFFYLALDDRFAIHERVRDLILIPNDIAIPYLPIGTGDFILLVYMAFGLFILKWVIPLFKDCKKAKLRFLIGVSVAVIAVLMDAYDIHQLSDGIKRAEQTIEECVELVAQILFMQGIIIAWFCDIKKQIQSKHQKNPIVPQATRMN